MPSAEVEVLTVQRQRRFSAEEKQRLVEQTLQPGMTVSLVARQFGVSPSLLFRWRKLSSEGALSAVEADEEVVPASEVKALHQQIRELQRLLDKKTQEAEILRKAVEVAREKNWLVRSSWSAAGATRWLKSVDIWASRAATSSSAASIGGLLIVAGGHRSRIRKSLGIFEISLLTAPRTDIDVCGFCWADIAAGRTWHRST